MDGVYEPIEIERLSEDTLQGHSDVLDLDIRWHDGRLEWYDPETGRHIVTFDDERARADAVPRPETASWRRSCGDCAASRDRRSPNDVRSLSTREAADLPGNRDSIERPRQRIPTRTVSREPSGLWSLQGVEKARHRTRQAPRDDRQG